MSDTTSNELSTTTDDTTNLPVTVVITRKVLAGKEKEYEQLLSGVLKAALAFPGHMGVNVMRPPAGSREWTLVFRFDTVDNLRRWEDSAERAGWVVKLDAVSDGKPQVQKLTGMEAWFAMPGQTVRPPARYKMAVVSWLAAFPLVQLLTGVILPRLDFMPPLIKGFLMSVTMIIMMTYVVMPRLTKAMAWWLYPPS